MAGSSEPVAERAAERPPETVGPETVGPETAGSQAAGSRLARWDVATLCGDTGEAILVHKGEDYRLRITARGRLILTK
jgi:hemin uptake protein HemP